MKNLTIILALLIVTVGCNSMKKEDDPNLKMIDINFADAQMGIPKSFKIFNPDSLIVAIKNSGESEYTIQTNVYFIENIKSHPWPYLMYTDTIDIFNRIFFAKGDHVLLTKELAQVYVGEIEIQLQSNWETQGINYERIKSKFSKKKNVQVIKLKYKLSYLNSTSYFSQYIITTLTQTIGITCTSIKENDFDGLINGLRIE